jgi:hypothetical protein
MDETILSYATDNLMNGYETQSNYSTPSSLASSPAIHALMQPQLIAVVTQPNKANNENQPNINSETNNNPENNSSTTNNPITDLTNSPMQIDAIITQSNPASGTNNPVAAAASPSTEENIKQEDSDAEAGAADTAVIAGATARIFSSDSNNNAVTPTKAAATQPAIQPDAAKVDSAVSTPVKVPPVSLEGLTVPPSVTKQGVGATADYKKEYQEYYNKYYATYFNHYHNSGYSTTANSSSTAASSTSDGASTQSVGVVSSTATAAHAYANHYASYYAAQHAAASANHKQQQAAAAAAKAQQQQQQAAQSNESAQQAAAAAYAASAYAAYPNNPAAMPGFFPYPYPYAMQMAAAAQQQAAAMAAQMKQQQQQQQQQSTASSNIKPAASSTTSNYCACAECDTKRAAATKAQQQACQCADCVKAKSNPAGNKSAAPCQCADCVKNNSTGASYKYSPTCNCNACLAHTSNSNPTGRSLNDNNNTTQSYVNNNNGLTLLKQLSGSNKKKTPGKKNNTNNTLISQATVSSHNNAAVLGQSIPIPAAPHQGVILNLNPDDLLNMEDDHDPLSSTAHPPKSTNLSAIFKSPTISSPLIPKLSPGLSPALPSSPAPFDGSVFSSLPIGFSPALPPLHHSPAVSATHNATITSMMSNHSQNHLATSNSPHPSPPLAGLDTNFSVPLSRSPRLSFMRTETSSVSGLTTSMVGSTTSSNNNNSIGFSFFSPNPSLTRSPKFGLFSSLLNSPAPGFALPSPSLPAILSKDPLILRKSPHLGPANHANNSMAILNSPTLLNSALGLKAKNDQKDDNKSNLVNVNNAANLNEVKDLKTYPSFDGAASLNNAATKAELSVLEEKSPSQSLLGKLKNLHSKADNSSAALVKEMFDKNGKKRRRESAHDILLHAADGMGNNATLKSSSLSGLMLSHTPPLLPINSNYSSTINSLTPLNQINSHPHANIAQCHQCRQRKSILLMVYCCNHAANRRKYKAQLSNYQAAQIAAQAQQQAIAKGRKVHDPPIIIPAFTPVPNINLVGRTCGHRYCESCLSKYYNEKPQTKKPSISAWECPVCRDVCACSQCKKNKERIKNFNDPATMQLTVALASALVHIPLLLHSNMKSFAEEVEAEIEEDSKSKLAKKAANNNVAVKREGEGSIMELSSSDDSELDDEPQQFEEYSATEAESMSEVEHDSDEDSDEQPEVKPKPRGRKPNNNNNINSAQKNNNTAAVASSGGKRGAKGSKALKRPQSAIKAKANITTVLNNEEQVVSTNEVSGSNATDSSAIIAVAKQEKQELATISLLAVATQAKIEHESPRIAAIVHNHNTRHASRHPSPALISLSPALLGAKSSLAKSANSLLPPAAINNLNQSTATGSSILDLTKSPQLVPLLDAAISEKERLNDMEPISLDSNAVSPSLTDPSNSINPMELS